MKPYRHHPELRNTKRHTRARKTTLTIIGACVLIALLAYF
jgi:hypothetical protein